MRYLLNSLKAHFKTEFDWVSVLLILLFTSVFVVLQYEFQLIRSQITTLPHLYRIPFYWLLFVSVFTGSCFILYKRKQIDNVFIQPEFWKLTAVVFLITAFDQSYFLLSIIKEMAFSNSAVKAAVVSIATHSVSLFSVIIPVLIYYFTIEKNRSSFYGLSFGRKVNVKPYFMVLFIVLLLIAVGSLSSGIGSYYPVYAKSGLYKYAGELGISKWASVAIFETIYAADFIAVELFFRGFLLFTLGRLIGKQVILPMAACYMIFHFGKPLIETISSFFGGYILGVFAWRTGNIWGGIILHIGTALFMEIIASFI